MREIQQEILCALLQSLLTRDLITQDIHDKSKARICGTLDLPEFFWDNEAGKEDVHGCTKDTSGIENGQTSI